MPTSTPSLTIQQLDGVAPLDAPFDSETAKTVPDALHPLLFGSTSLRTYAVVDAARIANLPELLSTSGLAHKCLFTGDAAKTLDSVAPWIVELSATDAFTRNLFTHDPKQDAPWHLWRHNAAIFVRSKASLDQVWGHFRKLTRVKDENGKWFYFRFLEPGIQRALWTTFADDPSHIAWRFGTLLSDLFFRDGDTVVHVSVPELKKPATGAGNLISQYRPHFAIARWQQFRRRIFDALLDDQIITPDTDPAEIETLCDTMRTAGYKREAAIWNMVRAAILYQQAGHNMHEAAKKVLSKTQPADDVAASKAILKDARTLTKASTTQ